MSDEGTLYFLPWMRRGLARSLSAVAVDGAPTTDGATVDVSVVVGDGSGVGDSAPIVQAIALRGPGDVVGVSGGQVVRTDPAEGVRDFESNYFVAVELVTPDLPWMFTPAAPDAADKLVPWLALVVVRDDGANRIASKAGALLPVLSVADAVAELPSLDEAWAWAHVQSTADLSTTDVDEAYAAAPEDFLARLVCPRRLDPETSYIAAVVPTFEAGRRAGLGLPQPSAPDVSKADWWQAWATGTHAVDLPVFYSWSFRTGAAGDFEELVRRLTPRELDAGTHDFDIGDQGTDRLPPPRPHEKLISWKGALVSPAATVLERDEAHWDALRQAMRPIVQEGLRDGSEPAEGEAYDPLVHDPVVGPPAYGALASEEDRIPQPVRAGQTVGRQHLPLWFGQANLDPDQRSVGGLGAEVVRRNQEALMASAWSQAASLTEINRLLNWTRLAAEVGEVQKTTKLGGLTDAELVQAAAPASRRLRVDAHLTVSGRLAATSLPGGIVSAAFRRICRPEGPVGRARRGTRALEPNAATALTRTCLEDLAAVLAPTALVRPAGVQIAAETVMAGLPGSADLSSSRTASSMEPAAGGTAPSVDPPGVAPDTQPSPPTGRAKRIRRKAQRLAAEAIEAPVAAGSGASATRIPLVRDRGPLDGVSVQEMPNRFVDGSPWVQKTTRTVAYQVEVVGQAELAAAAGEIRGAIRPRAALAAKLADRITTPGEPFANDTVPASLPATPVFPDPLYEKLRAIDAELLLPGVGAIPDDTVGLCTVNAAFVEVFLLGANEELAREFLWREYPAELGDTWLRTFWDSIPEGGADAEAGGDIPPIAEWSARPYGRKSPLGAHQIGFGADGTLVLVIKGELLRKYPDTVIYASKAVWNEARTGSDGEPVPANTLREEELDADGFPAERKDPLFVGALDRDTVFLGFDLDTKDALGPVDVKGLPIPGGNKGDRDGGWFFVFEEPPTGPRFGLDVGREGQAGSDVDRKPNYWRNASWYHQVDTPEALAGLTHAQAEGRLAGSARRWYDDPSSAGGGQFQARWGTDASAMARITLQRPVRMLVHASAMLPEEGAAGGGAPPKPTPKPELPKPTP